MTDSDSDSRPLSESESAATPQVPLPAAGISKWKILIGAGATILIAVLVVVGPQIFQSGFNPNDDLRYLPSNPYVIGVIRIDAIVASSPYRELRAELARVAPDQDPDRQFLAATGISVSEVSHITIAVGEHNQFAALLHATQPVLPGDLISNMRVLRSPDLNGGRAAWVNRKFMQVKIGDFVIHDEEGLTGFGFSVVEPKTILFSDPLLLRKILQRTEIPSMSADMQRVFAQGDRSHHVFVAASFKQAPPLRQDGLLGYLAGFTREMEELQLEANIGKEIQVLAVADYKDAPSASNAWKMGQKLIGDFGPTRFSKESSPIKLGSDGKRVRLTAALPPALLATAIGTARLLTNR